MAGLIGIDDNPPTTDSWDTSGAASTDLMPYLTRSGTVR